MGFYLEISCLFVFVKTKLTCKKKGKSKKQQRIQRGLTCWNEQLCKICAFNLFSIKWKGLPL